MAQKPKPPAVELPLKRQPVELQLNIKLRHYQRLEQLAKDTGQSMSKLLEDMIEQALEHLDRAFAREYARKPKRKPVTLTRSGDTRNRLLSECDDTYPTPLGKCCNCDRSGPSVRNIVMVARRSPEPGYGCWGCLICDLETAGAVAVLCDECMRTSHGHPKQICLGPPPDNRRLPIEQAGEPFDHDKSKHPAGDFPEESIH